MQKGQGKILLVGLIIVFALFQLVANALGSDRGQYGVLVGLVVVAATLLAENLLFRKSFKDAAKQIGLLRPKKAGIQMAIAIGVLLLLMIPAFGWAKNVSFGFYPEWYRLLPGLFFQAGIGEETLFRGYLFGHLRNRHGFWQAAVFAAIPFVIVHLILFFSLPWSIAIASILLSIAMSFPFSRLYEMGGNTMWAPAIVHFVSQAGVKLVVTEGESGWIFPLFWIAICALIPLIVYAIPPVYEAARKRLVKAVVPAMGIGNSE